MTSTNTDEVSRVALLEQIHHLAFADAGALVDEEGLRPISMLSKEEAVALVYIEEPLRSGRGKEMPRPIKLGISDKIQSLALFATVHRLLTAPVPKGGHGEGFAHTARADMGHGGIDAAGATRGVATRAASRGLTALRAIRPRTERHRERRTGDRSAWARCRGRPMRRAVKRKTTGRKKGSSLTARQVRFVKEYLMDLNGTQAAIRSGYSPRTAKEQAARLLTNVHVKAAVDAGKAKLHAQVDLTAEKVIAELLRVAYAEVDTTDIRVSDKLRALELLAKHMGLLVERVDVRVDVEVAKGLQRGRELNRLAEARDGDVVEVTPELNSPGDGYVENT